MSWVRFVPGFTRHPKRLKSGPISSWLWACSVDHCMMYLTDGFLDDMAISGLCPTVVGVALKRAVENLVACGSWERVQGGYRVHGYLEHNLSRAQIEADRTTARERYQLWKSRQTRTQETHRDAPLPNVPPTPLATPELTPLPTPPQRRYQRHHNAEATFLSDGRSVGRSVGQSKDETTSKDGSRPQQAESGAPSPAPGREQASLSPATKRSDQIPLRARPSPDPEM